MNDDKPYKSIPKKSWIERMTDSLSGEPKSRDDIKEILSDARDNGLIDAEVYSIIEGAMDVSDQHVSDVMIPRAQMVSVNINQSVEEMLPIMMTSSHSRFPVLGSSSDEVVGILLAKDLLALCINTQFDFVQINQRLKEVVRPAWFVPESKRLNTLLKEFRNNRNHMAMVVNEYGGIDGLVTIEDVLEEIVGNIEDEHDPAQISYITHLQPEHFAVQALTPIDEFNQFFSTQFSDDDFDTIGGIVVHHFGRLPKRGESVRISGIEFTVRHANDRQVKELMVIANKQIAAAS